MLVSTVDHPEADYTQGVGAKVAYLAVCLVSLGLFPAAIQGQLLAPTDPRIAATPRPEQDDATLHDVAFAGTKVGLAVGDHGTVWRTADGGRTWDFRATPTDAALQSVCLLTDQIGWAAGMEIAPGTRIATGVVLATQDGGTTWTRVDAGQLPPVFEVRFFDLEHGTVAGYATDLCATGLLTTDDGGQTWLPVQGARSNGWTAAAFLDQQHGTVVGARDRQATYANGRLLPHAATASLRGLHDVALDRSGLGWLVGDGATLRMTTDRGVSWPPPPTAPHDDLRGMQDFTAVASHGNHVWVAGSPGSVIWHSPDAGLTWEMQSTGDPTPIRGICFTTEQFGYAVGEFGSIRVTQDGGRSWLPIRGGSRRPALLSLHAHPEQLPARILSREAAENGYRCVSLFVARRDVGPDQLASQHLADRLRAACLAATGNDATTQWQLPLTLPELDRQRDALIAEWSRLHEGKLPEVMVGGLVATLRMYRPEVLVYDEAPPDDAVTALLNEALVHAVAQAADSTRYPEHRTLLGLAPWSVNKVFVRTSDAARATLTINPFQILPRQGTMLQHAASRAVSRAFDSNQIPTEKEHYRLVQMAPALTLDGGADPASSPHGRSFFSGLQLSVGGDVRRVLPPITNLDDEQLAVLSRHQRDFSAYASRALDDPARAGQLIAQLRETTAPLPPAEAAQVLSDLADEYRSRSQWDYVEDTLVELVERYPDQPPARAAMRWLFARWNSQEVLWQRLRSITAESPGLKLAPEILQANFETAMNAPQEVENAAQLQQRIADLPSPLVENRQPGSVRAGSLRTFVDLGSRNVAGSPIGTGVNQLDVEVDRRRQRAERLRQVIEAIDPALYAQPEMQFVRAAQLRAQSKNDAAQAIYRGFFGLDDGITPWNQTARGEIWAQSRGSLSPKPVTRCSRTSSAPVLDGLLADPCWANSLELHLATEDEVAGGDSDPTFVGNRSFSTGTRERVIHSADAPAGIVMLCYDDRYLYLAASLPRHARTPLAEVKYPGRTHDADLHPFDRISFAFDVDRDYATWYRFDVDQRGWTQDSLAEDARWNPEWFVAAETDAEHWRIEAAIPLEQLVPAPPTRGTVWAAAITRIIPAAPLQTWTHPASLSPQGEALGLIQFD